MKIKNPETGEVIVVPQGMEDAVRDAIESGNDPIEVMQMKYGGIHINPANKGKFNATKKATGKTTEELTHSKNPLTRKRAVFAQNAKKWKHQDGGQAMQQEDQMQQLIQIAEQALSQGAAPEQVAQMLVEKGVPEQVVQQVIQYAIQDLQQQSQGQNPEEQMQQQNPQEGQAEMGYGGYMQKGGNVLSKEATIALQNPNIRSQAYINGAYETFMKTGDTNALNDYNAYTEANKYLLQRDSVQNANNTDYYPYGKAPRQFYENPLQKRFIKKQNGGKLNLDMYNHGGMIKRADGSYSKRGLWDNIRANKGSGKAPTKEMLKQEKKIKAAEKAMGGMMYGNGGITDNNSKKPQPSYNFPVLMEKPTAMDSTVYENKFYNMLQQNPYAIKSYNDMQKYGISPSLDKNVYIQATMWRNAYEDALSKLNKKEYGGYMYADGGKLPKEVLRSRLESHMSSQEADNYLKQYANGGSFDNPGFRALPMYVQEKIKSNMAYGGCMECGGKMETGGRFLRKAQAGLYDPAYNYMNTNSININPSSNNLNWGQDLGLNTMGVTSFANYNNQGYDPNTGSNFNTNFNWNNPPSTYSSMPGNMQLPQISTPQTPKSLLQNQSQFRNTPLTDRYNSKNILSGKTNLYEEPIEGPNLNLNEQDNTNKGKSNWFNNYGNYLNNLSGGNSYFGRGIQHLGEATFDFTKGGLELAGANISNRNALGDEANNLRSAMRNDYQRTGKRPTDGNAIINKYGGKMMQDGGATYADKMKVSKNSPEADFVAEKGEYIVNNGIASKLETGGSHASGNDTAISLDKSQSPSYVLSDTPRLKQLQFGGKRVSPAKYAEMATVEALGKTPDQILKGYTAFTKRAGTEGKVFGDKISDATNQLLAQKYQKDLATVKQIADQAYHKQEQLKYAMGMDNDLDHAQQVNGIQMSQYGGMQDDVHMNYFNAPAVQYGGSPQLFSDPSGLGYNTTQMAYGGMPMAYGGLPKMQAAGKALNTTRQQSQIDYEKQYGVKTNTGDVGVDKYADIQNKSKIGFGKAEENLKSFSQWKGIYPGYDELMKEVNKPGGPGKNNPKVGTFQTWMNKDYIPQQVEKLNTERTAAGQPTYDATQLAQLKTDLINDYGFDDTTGQKVDSDFGAFTSSRTPINFSFNKKEEEKKKEEPPVVKGDETKTPDLSIDKEEEKPYYDFPAINAYLPQPYGRNPIGLALAQPQTIRPAKLNIQPELNEYTRGMRGALRGTQGNTSVNVAQQMQGLNNLYGAQNRLFGQKYNFDEQSRMGAEQFNAQAIMNTDAANLQRIGVQQDLINRREGILDTQRRKDFEKGIQNADKQNAYGLSKDYIESTFGPYLNNKGKLDLVYNPITGEKINKDKEKTYTRAEYDKMIADEKKAAGSKRYGGSVKKIKLKLRK